MADGATPEQDMTPDERVDAAIASARAGREGPGQIGSGSLGIGGSGGGGAGGQFVFADLAALDTAITRWTALRDRIAKRGQLTKDAIELCNPPAEDMMSHYQANKAKETMEKKLEHNNAMLAYAQAYVDKLTASRASMASTEQANADRLRNTGGDLGHA